MPDRPAEPANAWYCEHYGAEGVEFGAVCFVEARRGRVCADPAECHRNMAAARGTHAIPSPTTHWPSRCLRRDHAANRLWIIGFRNPNRPPPPAQRKLADRLHNPHNRCPK